MIRLADIAGPADLHALSPADLRRIADELREAILDHVATHGGHLGASLGTVELTVALHAAFDSPTDALVWDVGHQAYGHKLLTGRRDRFGTTRKLDGLSGFPSRTESEHDAFGVGHASTALSAALGLATARDLTGGTSHVVAVVGDGALSGGLAFEALNNLGRTRLIVVLNDNGIGIDPSVGAVGRHLAELASGADPSGGLFGALGLDYLGPVDGHDLAALGAALTEAKARTRPVVVHVRTVKGKGYGPAEADQVGFHGMNPFDKVTGLPLKPSGGGPPSYTDVFAAALVELAAADPSIVGITAAMPSGTGLNRLMAAFPERGFDVGIAEGHAVTFAAGLAAAGLTPVVALYSTFLQRGYDGVIHDVALQDLPVVFALDRAGLVGADGPTHHGAFDIAYLRAVPNLVLMAPADEAELRDMLFTATRFKGGPSAIRYPRGAGPGASLRPEFSELPIGRGEIVRSGTDVALLAYGSLVGPATVAAEMLTERGVSAAVVNLRFAKPLDGELINQMAAACGRLVTLEEGTVSGGVGSAVLEHLSARGQSVPTLCLGLPDRFVAHGTPAELARLVGLDPPSLAVRIADWLSTVQPRP